ncbi:hypothetical protein M427DRAFT_59450, partial [Gonapodya prolifera JEL478]
MYKPKDWSFFIHFALLLYTSDLLLRPSGITRKPGLDHYRENLHPLPAAYREYRLFLITRQQ